jgi:hypothetical protein
MTPFGALMLGLTEYCVREYHVLDPDVRPEKEWW